MKQIALISHSPNFTGAEKMLLNLAILLKQSPEDINPVLIIPGEEGGLATAAISHGIDIRMIKPIRWYVFANSNDGNYWNNLSESYRDIEFILKEKGCDCVLVNTLTNIGGAMAAVELQIPLLVWVHGVIDSFLIPRRSSPSWAHLNDRFLFDSASNIIAVSQWVQTFITEVAGYKEKTVQIYNWTQVHPEMKVDWDKRSRNFVCLNTFDPHKGHETLLEACLLLRKKKWHFKVDLYGTGETLNTIKLKTKKMGLEQIVRFHPRTTDVDDIYQNAFCVVNPSFIEPFGMTLIEAMAQMTPVIAAQSGGPDEFIQDKVNGLLHPPGDAAALAQCMEDLLVKPEFARALGEAGYKTVLERFDGDNALKQFAEIIHHTIDGFSGYHSSVKTQCAFFQLLFEDHSIPRLNGQNTLLPDSDAKESLAQSQYALAQTERRNMEIENTLRMVRQDKIQQIINNRSSRYHKLFNLVRWVSFVRHPISLESQISPAFKQLHDDSYLFIPSIKKYMLQTGEYLNGLIFQEYSITFNHPNLNGVLAAPIIEIPATTGMIGLEIVSPQKEIITRVELPLQNVSNQSPIKFSFAPIPATKFGKWGLRIYVGNADTSIHLYEWKRVSFFKKGWFNRQPFFGFTFLD
jgi:glycosyltransferase involved in cell wall biosynthesis